MKQEQDLSLQRRCIVVDPRRIALGLAAIVVLLVAASLIGQLIKYRAGYGHVYGLVPLFDVGQEHNIPTYFSSLLLLLAAILLGAIAVYKRNEADALTFRWKLLALAFLYVSLDEVAMIHELLIRPMREWFDVGGLLYFGWVAPFAILLIVASCYFARLYVSLPPRTKRLCLSAAALYVGGAMGVELLGGRHVELYGSDNLQYKFYQTLEESLEMLGVILLIYALLDYMRVHAPPETLSFYIRR